jgi:pantoate--beta-alanine ligase
MALPKLAAEPILIETTPAGLRRWCDARRRAGERIGLVPTMGALHKGHMALVSALNEVVDRVIVSIFVNPTQFGPNEDFTKYPRTETEDLDKLISAGVDVAYMPTVEAMYPQGFTTDIRVKGLLTEGLEAVVRPGHFTGVTTVVGKLLLQALPDVAAFGEKDYQQLQVVRRMSRDLDLPIQILPVPTVRDPEGLALSSRNAYLSPDELRIAQRLNKILGRVARRLRAGADALAACQTGAREIVAAGFAKVDYLTLAHPDDLTPLPWLDRPARLLVAARLGPTRLIDNIAVLPA